jgi:hypothetical protein
VSGFLSDEYEDINRIRVLPRGAQSPNSPMLTLDDTDGDLGQALQLAALTGNFARPGNDTMQKQHVRLLDAFRESEGRDPSPDGDGEFWKAYNSIHWQHTGEEPATVPGDTFYDDDPATDWERMGKSKDAPPWLEEFAEQRGTTVEGMGKELRKALAEMDESQD